MGVHRVTWGHTRLHGVTQGLYKATQGHMGLQRVTYGYIGLHIRLHRVA